jgi:hypothetical protein
MLHACKSPRTERVTCRRDPIGRGRCFRNSVCEGSNPFAGTIVLRIVFAVHGRDTSPWWNWHTQQLEVLRSIASLRVRVPPVTPLIHEGTEAIFLEETAMKKRKKR